jgi:hypothetical protein
MQVKPDILKNKYFYSPYSNETFYTKALEYKQVFYTYSRSENDEKFERYSTFSQYETQNVWPSSEYKYMIFGLCNVLRHLTPHYFVRISMVVFVLKGGKYSPRYLH